MKCYLTEGEALEEACGLINGDQDVYLVVPFHQDVRRLMDRAHLFLDTKYQGLPLGTRQEAARITFQNERRLVFISSPMKERIRGVRAAAFETTDRTIWVRIDGPDHPDFNRRLIYQTRYERLG